MLFREQVLPSSAGTTSPSTPSLTRQLGCKLCQACGVGLRSLTLSYRGSKRLLHDTDHLHLTGRPRSPSSSCSPLPSALQTATASIELWGLGVSNRGGMRFHAIETVCAARRSWNGEREERTDQRLATTLTSSTAITEQHRLGRCGNGEAGAATATCWRGPTGTRSTCSRSSTSRAGLFGRRGFVASLRAVTSVSTSASGHRMTWM